MDEVYYSIGEFASLSNVTTKTLRHYDKIGLLKPAYIDEDNNRRYYTKEQLYLINMIRTIKTLGFSLYDIKSFRLNEDIEPILKLFKTKKIEIESQITELLKSKHVVDNWILGLTASLEDEYKQKEITIKSINERTIVFKRDKINFTFENVFSKTKEFETIIDKYNLQHVTGFYTHVYHDDLDNLNYNNTDFEICRNIYRSIDFDNIDNKTRKQIIRQIPKGDFASIIHKGDFESLINSYVKLKSWIKENNYSIAGPTICIFIIPFGWVNSQNDIVRELQIRIEE